MKRQHMTTRSTYQGEHHYRNEDGKIMVAKFSRPISVTLQVTEDKRIFFRGARVA